jgi:hypothetical protein
MSVSRESLSYRVLIIDRPSSNILQTIPAVPAPAEEHGGQAEEGFATRRWLYYEYLNRYQTLA